MRVKKPEVIAQNRIRVIEAANAAFRTQGIKEVTMDRIARSIRMSKRTIYEMFTSKEALLLECVKANTDRREATFEMLRTSSENALEFLLRAMEYALRELDTYSHKTFHEIVIYPTVQTYLLQHRQEQKEKIVSLVRQGIEEGYFRQSLSPEIVHAITSQILNIALEDETLASYTPSQLFLNTVLIYFSGCVTPKGSTILEAFFERYQ